MASSALTVSIEESSTVTRTLKIEVPADRVTLAHGTVVQEFRRQARVPGFRPGKAPQQVVEASYKADIERSLLERLVRESLDEAMAKLDVPVLNVRDILPEAVAKAAAFKYSAVVEVPPKIEPKGYKKLKVLRPTKTAEAKDVDQVVENLRERNATYRAGSEGDSVGAGDRATLSYTAFENGQPVPDGKVENYETQIGGGSLHPKFEQNLAGAKAGDNLKFQIAFGDTDAPNEQLKNKTIDFEVAVVSLQKRELPELNDTFAAKMLSEATLASLRERIESDLNAAYVREATQAVESQVVQQLLELHDFAVPEGTVARRRESLAQETAGRLMQQGYPKKAVQDLLPMIFQDQAPRAERDVRVAFLLDAIAKAEKIEIADVDVETELAQFAESEGKTKESALAEAKQQGHFESVRGELRNRKALNLAIESASVKEVTPEAFKEHQEKIQADKEAARKNPEGKK